MTRIAVVGLPSFGRLAAEALRAEGWDAAFVPAASRSPRWAATAALRLGAADLVYAIGSSIERRSPLDLVARARNPRILMHWVGTDVEYGRKAWDEGRASPRVVGAHHWADAPWLIDELRPIGISATLQQLPGAFTLGEPAPLPATFGVLVYLQREPHAAYDVEGTLAVMDALPDVQFVVVGGFPQDRLPAHARARGFVDDMASAYRETCGLLRLVHHDGMAVSVLEAQSFGRRAAWKYPLPGVDRVAGPEEAIAVIRRWRDAFGAGSLAPDPAIAARIAEDYNPETVRAQVSAGLKRLLA